MSREVPLFPAAREGSDIEHRSLLGNKNFPHLNDQILSTEKLYRNFYLMSIAFGIIHGCAVTCIAFASTELGDKMGSVTSGILHVGYALTSFMFAKPLVSSLGPKLSMLLGSVGYTFYVGGFFTSMVFIDLGSLTMNMAWLTSTVTAVVGGISGGLMWTAQGALFAQNSKIFCENTGSDLEEVNNTFASIFATTFLGIEMITKLFATVIYLIIPKGWAPYVLFSLYTAASLASCFLIATMHSLGVEPTFNFTYKEVSKSAGATAKLCFKEPRMALLIPYQLAFGFTSSFVPYYIYGTLVSKSEKLGSTYVGVLSAVVALTATSVALPSAFLAHKYGKRYVIFIGVLSLLGVGGCFILANDATLGSWYVLFPLLIVYGIGKGIWESSNKAVITDFFLDSVENTTTAFTAVEFFNGYAGALAFFTFMYLPRRGMAWTIVILSFIGLISYTVAFLLNDVKRAEAKIDKKALIHEEYLKYKEAHKHQSLSSSSEDHIIYYNNSEFDDSRKNDSRRGNTGKEFKY